MDSVASPEDQEHSNGGSGGSMLRERRFKLSRACDRCRRRRIKCDEGHPCQSCLNANSACTFEEPGKRTHPHKSKRASTLEDRMTHLETLIQAIPTAVFNPGLVQLGTLGQFDPANAHTINPASLLPLGVPPPALSVQPLVNPSTHFSPYMHIPLAPPPPSFESPDRLTQSLSYLYLDDQGSTRWQGETSGLPLLDFLVERDTPMNRSDWIEPGKEEEMNPAVAGEGMTAGDWFPDRKPMTIEINPEKLWKIITTTITPDLMDSLVQCFLSTTHYMMPFLHVPTFLADYGNPVKWGEPGFASFILAVCCLSSRHIDDPRVRSDPTDPFSAGAQWFELFSRMRTLPTADRPTLYTVQSVLVAGVYAIGLGKLSKAFALLSEAVTLSIDSGIHRSVQDYDCFNPIEAEIRKRTFWCVYAWDKQAGAVFGRPPMIRLRDCDVEEPCIVDDEFITKDGITKQPGEGSIDSRIGAFVITNRLFVVMEAVLDAHPPRRWPSESSSFLARASAASSSLRGPDLLEEQALLDEIFRTLPPHWAHTPETMSSDDVIRLTQAERLHSLGQFVAMLIHRYRFSALVVGEEGTRNVAAVEAQMKACHACAVQIISSHLHMATKGLMTYYGVHVIHQLTQAGRTLVAVLLECKTEETKPLIAPGLDALRSCVGLLRRFSGRYVCGLRSADLIEEVCRLSFIPLGTTPRESQRDSSRHPPWLRPVRKKSSPPSQRSRSTHSGYESSDSPLAGGGANGDSAMQLSYDRVGRKTRSSYASSSPEITLGGYTGGRLSPRHPLDLHSAHSFGSSPSTAEPPHSNSNSNSTSNGPNGQSVTQFARHSPPHFTRQHTTSPHHFTTSQPSQYAMNLDLDPTSRPNSNNPPSDSDIMALLSSSSAASDGGGFDNPFDLRSMYHHQTEHDAFGNPTGGSPPAFVRNATPTGGGLGGYLGVGVGLRGMAGGSPTTSPV